MPRRSSLQPSSLWPDLVISSAETSDAILRATAAGQLKSIARPFYTPAIDEDPATVVRRNAWKVVGSLVPGGVISFRTALEARPAEDGTVFLVSTGRYQRDLPGLRIRAVAGPGPQPTDAPFIAGLHLASRARAMMETLLPSRARGTVARGLTAAELEVWLEKDFQSGGESALNRLRDAARTLTATLNTANEFSVLDRLIGQLLGTRAKAPTTASAIARLATRRAARCYGV